MATVTTRGPLVETKACETSMTRQYESPAGTTTAIENFICANPTASPITIDVHLVPPGGSPGTSNIVVSAQAVGAGADLSLARVAGQDLAPGGAIWAQASASGLVIRSTGRRITG